MKLLLIDGNSLLFRAYFATAYQGVDKIMRNKDGYPTNAIYGLANIVTKVLNQTNPDYALVAFDTSKPTFRHKQFEDYKGGRKETPLELKQQFLPAREMLKDMGLFVYELEGYEADDIIGTASLLASPNDNVEIYSADRDLLQLIKENVHVCLTKKGVTDLKIMTVESLKEELGISPIQITDLKGLMGDASDNIPGIEGIGEKTALKFLQEYGTVENVVEADIKGKTGEKIKAQKDTALMSKQLATINKQVPIDFKLDDLKYIGHNQDKLSEFFRFYGMYSLDKKLIGKKTVESISYQIVDEIPVDFLKQDLAIFIDVEKLNYHIDNIIGIALSNGVTNYFVSYDNIAKNKALKAYLEDSNYCKYTYDIKKTLAILNRINIVAKCFDFDIMLGTYLLESQIKDDPINMFDYYGKIINSKPKNISTENLSELANYCCSIAYYTFILKNEVISRLSENGSIDLYNNVEIPLSKILSEMEINGILVDKELFENKCKDINDKLDNLTKEIYKLAGCEFNINSPSQLAEVLFDKLKLPSNRKRSTAIEELEFLNQFHPIISYIMEYRKYAKLLSTYFGGLQEYILDDGKIHTIYNQALTQTGRLSSREPNLQNISVRTEEGKEVRKGFIAPENKLLISFDYSQIELRVLADMANSSSLKEAFNSGIDIHAKTASQLFGVDINDVTDIQRRQAKTINFGMVYGMSAFELANELGIGFNAANEFMVKYFETYPEIKLYFNSVIENCEKCGFVKTKFGRQRRIIEINSSVYNEKERGKRMAMNTPIQGTAADIMKMQMIKVRKAIQDNNLDCKMLLQVHDEIVLEINECDLDKVVKVIKHAMEDFNLISVPLVVDYHYGKNWME